MQRSVKSKSQSGHRGGLLIPSLLDEDITKARSRFEEAEIVGDLSGQISSKRFNEIARAIEWNARYDFILKSHPHLFDESPYWKQRKRQEDSYNRLREVCKDAFEDKGNALKSVLGNNTLPNLNNFLAMYPIAEDHTTYCLSLAKKNVLRLLHASKRYSFRSFQSRQSRQNLTDGDKIIFDYFIQNKEVFQTLQSISKGSQNQMNLRDENAYSPGINIILCLFHFVISFYFFITIDFSDTTSPSKRQRKKHFGSTLSASIKFKRSISFDKTMPCKNSLFL